jgi:hypothetical protein
MWMSEEGKKKKAQEEKPLDKMTVKELRVVAAGIESITGASGMKKDDLLAAIRQAKGIAEEAPPKKAKRVKKVAAGPMTVQQMKAKIAELKQEREGLRAEGDREKLRIVRRRINRLKKRSRRPIAAA